MCSFESSPTNSSVKFKNLSASVELKHRIYKSYLIFEVYRILTKLY